MCEFYENTETDAPHQNQELLQVQVGRDAGEEKRLGITDVKTAVILERVEKDLNALSVNVVLRYDKRDQENRLRLNLTAFDKNEVPFAVRTGRPLIGGRRRVCRVFIDIPSFTELCRIDIDFYEGNTDKNKKRW